MALFAASRHGFRKIVSVDISQNLIDRAKRNLATYRKKLRCEDVQFLVCGVEDFVIPDTSTIMYLFNPADASVLTLVMGHIMQSLARRPRSMKLIYYNPKWAAELEESFPLQLERRLVFKHWGLYRGHLPLLFD